MIRALRLIQGDWIMITGTANKFDLYLSILLMSVNSLLSNVPPVFHDALSDDDEDDPDVRVFPLAGVLKIHLCERLRLRLSQLHHLRLRLRSLCNELIIC